MYRNVSSISRRTAVQSAAALATAASVQGATAQDASPQAEPAAVNTIPEFNTENQERGAGGELRILQWQAPTTFLNYKSTGVKDILMAQLVLEPLYVVMADASIAPILATSVPTKEEGTLAEDLTWAIVSLKPDVLWSDGTPFTAEDVRFTWEWNLNPNNGSFTYDNFATIQDVEIIDDLTVKFVFGEPNPIWFEILASSGSHFVLPKHILGENAQETNDAFGINPIGTGPFVVDSFTPNDQAMLSANPNFREPNKPFFGSVLVKGGGDPASAARAVLQTGEFDFAWYLNVEPDVLQPLATEDSPGVLEVTPTVTIEWIDVNHSDPRTEVDGEFSHKDTPHPIFSDIRVRQALAMAIDRELISNQLYVEGNSAAYNFIIGNDIVASDTDWYKYDPDGAAALMDEAGWILDGDVRKKDGQELSLTFATTVNSVRQKTQAIIQSNFSKLGIKVQLEQVDAGQFFDGSAGNDQNLAHFPWDLQMYATSVSSARPLRLMDRFYAGPNGERISQKSNGWSGSNSTRWQSAEYDATLEAARVETDDDKLVDLLIKSNDIAMEDVAVIPLVGYGFNVAYSKRLNPDNFGFSPFEWHQWNIANWNLREE